jgi:hypothetical protein
MMMTDRIEYLYRTGDAVPKVGGAKQVQHDIGIAAVVWDRGML